MEFLTIIAFLLISAIANWLQRRREGADNWEDITGPPGNLERRSPPGDSASTRPTPQAQSGTEPAAERKRSNWEEELRRMLGESPSRPTAPQAPAPDPAYRSETPAPVPPPLAPSPLESARTPADSSRATSVLSTPATPTSRPERSWGTDNSLQKQLEAAKKALEKAQRIRRTRHRRSPDAHSGVGTIRSQLASRKGLQTAIIASVVLGPPKAVDESPGGPFY